MLGETSVTPGSEFLQKTQTKRKPVPKLCIDNPDDQVTTFFDYPLSSKQKDACITFISLIISDIEQSLWVENSHNEPCDSKHIQRKREWNHEREMLLARCKATENSQQVKNKINNFRINYSE